MRKNFNINKFYDNLYYLIKEKEFKIGDVERYSSMQVGRISRGKRDSTQLPIDKVYYISQCLGCSIDDLCNKDFELENKKHQIKQLEQQIEILKMECNE